MSRTYRRKHGESPFWARTTCGYDSEGIWRRVPLEGDELVKSVAKYHSDSGFGHGGPSKWFKTITHREFKRKSKEEIIRYYKDEEYEVQILNNPRWPYWD